MSPKPFELAYSTACFPAESRREHLRNGSGARWCEVALSLADLGRPEPWQELLAQTQMTCWSVHAPFGPACDMAALDEGERLRALASAEQAAQFAAALGARHLVVHAGAEPVAPPERRQRLAASRRSLLALADVCAAAGVSMALEFLPRTCPGNSVAEIEYLLDGLAPEVAGVCLDTNHANLGQSIVDNVGALGGRIVTLHVSDNDAIDERHWLPGQGVINWRELIAALRRAGYAGPFMYESGRDRTGDEITPKAIRWNYERLVAPLLEG